MSIQDKISNLRTMAEIHFYELSKSFDKEISEKLSIVLLKTELKTKIQVNKEYLDASQTLLEKVAPKSNIYTNESLTEIKFNSGAQSILELRIRSHSEEINIHQEYLELLELNTL